MTHEDVKARITVDIQRKEFVAIFDNSNGYIRARISFEAVKDMYWQVKMLEEKETKAVKRPARKKKPIQRRTK